MLIGARGFEPPTSWSRTNHQYAILLIRLAFPYVLKQSLAQFSSRFVPILLPPCKRDFVHLAVVLDGHSHKVVGRALERTLASRLELAALEQIGSGRRPLHSLQCGCHPALDGLKFARECARLAWRKK